MASVLKEHSYLLSRAIEKVELQRVDRREVHLASLDYRHARGALKERGQHRLNGSGQARRQCRRLRHEDVDPAALLALVGVREHNGRGAAHEHEQLDELDDRARGEVARAVDAEAEQDGAVRKCQRGVAVFGRLTNQLWPKGGDAKAVMATDKDGVARRGWSGGRIIVQFCL